MKKTILLASILIGVLLFSSGYSDSRYRHAKGNEAPALSIAEADSVISADRKQGLYTLLTFWTSTDAPSRRAANLYTAWVRSHPGAPLNIVGVNFDESENLFNEIVRRDSLDADYHFNATDAEARAVTDNYGLRKGYGSVLIDPYGKIIAYNPTDEQLETLSDLR